jgi:hypothetical protein
MRPKSLTPWLVALVCFGPFLLAVLLYYGPWTLDWLPRLPGSRELVQPPVTLPSGLAAGGADDGAVAYRWSLIYVRIGACDEQCGEHLDRLRQVQGALGRDLDRTQRVYLYAGDAPRIPSDESLIIRPIAGVEGDRLVHALGAERLERGRVYIADPQRSLVAGYPPDVAQRELLRDLKRLLGASRTD